MNFNEQTGTDNVFNSIDIGNRSNPFLADIDGDGDLDAVIGNSTGTFNYYQNTGNTSTPTFTEQTGTNNPFNGIDAGATSAPSLVDLDKDDDLDAVVGIHNGTIVFYKNTGSSSSPTFSNQTGTNNPFNGIDVDVNSIPSFADLDNDGDFDAVVGELDGNLNYYQNTGTNTSPAFTEQTGTNNPFDSIDIGSYSAPSLVDLDEDGDIDLVVGKADGTLNYYQNTGTNTSPTFTEQTGSDNPFNGIDVGLASTPNFGDLDGDGDLDLVVGNSNGVIKFFELNQAPTGVSLSATSVNENVAANIVIGTFSTTDPDAGESFTYSLVSGAGDSDSFSIDGDQLKINASPDFESKSSYSIVVRITDSGNAIYEKTLSISVNDLNEAPTGVSLSATSINENVAANTVIGTFSTTDPDAGESFTYSLVSGAGDSDNSAFTIDGDQLKINASPDYETNSSYSIRVKTTDAGGESYEETISISVNDLTDNNITGTNANETFTATDEVDNIQAGGGNDVVNVSIANLQSNDSFDGGDGVDTLFVEGDNSSQTITLNLGNANQFDSLTGASLTNVTLSNFDNVNLVNFAGNANITGNAQNNFLSATINDDTLNGGDGNDTLYGGEGNDTLVGGAGNDYLADDKSGVDNMDGGEGNDTLRTSLGTLEPTSYFEGGNGVDTFILKDGISTDAIVFNLGQANQFVSINGSPSQVTLVNVENIDLTSFKGSGDISGNAQNNVLKGGIGNDIIKAGNGNDSIYGGLGSDTLTGGANADKLYLGVDLVTDTVNYSNGHGQDTVYQFVSGVNGDKISFSGITNIDVVTSGANTQLRVGDGIAANAGFGTGSLLMTIDNVVGFTNSDVNVNLFNQAAAGGFSFS